MSGLRITRVFDRADCPPRDCDFKISGSWDMLMRECLRDYECLRTWTYVVLWIKGTAWWEVWQEPIQAERVDVRELKLIDELVLAAQSTLSIENYGDALTGASRRINELIKKLEREGGNNHEE